eukprot:Gb_36107 [translate_table: standard]
MTHERCNYIIFLYEPAVITLKEVEKFLSSNLIEIITIIVEDYVHASKGLTRVFTDAGLMKYMFPISKMPKNGKDWPKITDMAAHNQRLLVFSSNSSKEATEGIAYQWNYTVEKKYGYGGTIPGSWHQTTSNLLTWTVFLLAINPQWQTILREEVISVCGTDLPDADMLSRLKSTSILGRLPVLTTLIFSTAIMSCITSILGTVKDLPDVEGDRLYGIKLLSISLGRKRVFWTCIYTTRHVLCCYGGGSYFFICLDQRRNH